MDPARAHGHSAPQLPAGTAHALSHTPRTKPHGKQAHAPRHLHAPVPLLVWRACGLNTTTPFPLTRRIPGRQLTKLTTTMGALSWVVRQSAELENAMTSVERMAAYADVESEAAVLAGGGGGGGGGGKGVGAPEGDVETGEPGLGAAGAGEDALPPPPPPPGWPSSGAVSFRGVRARYQPGLRPVLDGVSFDLAPGQMLGIVSTPHERTALRPLAACAALGGPPLRTGPGSGRNQARGVLGCENGHIPRVSATLRSPPAESRPPPRAAAAPTPQRRFPPDRAHRQRQVNAAACAVPAASHRGRHDMR